MYICYIYIIKATLHRGYFLPRSHRYHSYCCEYHDQNQFEKENIILFYISVNSLPLLEAKARVRAGQKPGSREWCRSHGEMHFIGLLLVAWSACFLIVPKTTCLGVAWLIVSYPSTKCQSRKYTLRRLTVQSGRDIFVNRGFFFPNDFSLSSLQKNV